jgi:hypothetical protein
MRSTGLGNSSPGQTCIQDFSNTLQGCCMVYLGNLSVSLVTLQHLKKSKTIIGSIFPSLNRLIVLYVQVHHFLEGFPRKPLVSIVLMVS